MVNKVAEYNSKYVMAISFVSALGGYLFGFDFAVISGALPFLKQAFGLTPVWEGFVTGSLALGCIIGCLMAGSIAEKYGRRPGLMLAAIIFAGSALAMAFASSLTIFIAMRLMAGIGVGMASLLSPLYIAEISPTAVRGRNVAINQLTIVVGILLTNLINYFLAGHGVNAWRWMFGLGFVPSFFFFIGVLWLPESPRWLIKAGREDEAQKVLHKIGNDRYATGLFNDIKNSLTGQKKGTWRALLGRNVWPAVTIGIGLAVFQQLCGINIVFNYTSTIFASVGANLDRQLFETIAIGFVNLLFTIVAMWQVEKLGRRPLMLIGSLGLGILYILLSWALYMQLNTGWISLIVLLSIAVYATSLAPVTWVLISEIFPNRIRGHASSVAIVSLWAAYFILVFTFPLLVSFLGTYGPFYLYAVICLIGFFFIKSKVRETKGRSLEEMDEVMVGH
jgi:MFS transporter, SP family, xylose:H+ symportor